jgi:chaperonin cofactor prefoldin
MDQANESTGDRTFTPEPKVDKTTSLRKQVQGTTKRIKTLREKLQDTDSDKQRERIENKIKRLRKRRSVIQGKIGAKKD